MFSRRTKIVATLGPATDEPGVLEALVAAGIDCARLNCSHGTAEDLRRRTAEVRAVAAGAGRSVGLLFDLQGPKLRLSAGLTPRVVQAGEMSRPILERCGFEPVCTMHEVEHDPL